MSSRARKLAQLISILEVTDALVVLVQSEPNYEKGKRGKIRVFWPKKVSNINWKGNIVKFVPRVAEG